MKKRAVTPSEPDASTLQHHNLPTSPKNVIDTLKFHVMIMKYYKFTRGTCAPILPAAAT